MQTDIDKQLQSQKEKLTNQFSENSTAATFAGIEITTLLIVCVGVFVAYFAYTKFQQLRPKKTKYKV